MELTVSSAVTAETAMAPMMPTEVSTMVTQAPYVSTTMVPCSMMISMSLVPVSNCMPIGGLVLGPMSPVAPVRWRLQENDAITFR